MLKFSQHVFGGGLGYYLQGINALFEITKAWYQKLHVMLKSEAIERIKRWTFLIFCESSLTGQSRRLF